MSYGYYPGADAITFVELAGMRYVHWPWEPTLRVHSKATAIPSVDVFFFFWGGADVILPHGAQESTIRHEDAPGRTIPMAGSKLCTCEFEG